MREIKVNLKKHSYKIIVGKDNLNSLGPKISGLSLGKDAYIITNKAIKAKFARAIIRALKPCGFNLRFYNIPDTEKSKSIKTAAKVISDIAKYDKKRKIFILAFGGGVVGDLAGFVASIYKRGVPYVQVPTTLLAQVDSSIGGKTAVDLSEGKNLVGAFYQPRLVFSDVRLLATLKPRQVRSGLAEVIKYAIIKKGGLLSYIERHYKEILNLELPALEYIVKESSKIKARIVQEDEREEKGIRTILNFGHTIGHAVETAGNYSLYSHGEAIALGMLVACDISKTLKYINQETSARIEKIIKMTGLPIKIRKLDLHDIIKAHYRDKKFSGSSNRLVLLRGIGKPIIKENVPLSVITEAVRKRM
ncbi:MAG: 3-dehydroquinate synthase [Candidatus Omnitrophota bacterium]